MPDRTGAILGQRDRPGRPSPSGCWTTRACWRRQAARYWPSPAYAHYFLDQVQEQVGIPILHMIRETARLLVSQGRKRPGILATDGTIQTGLYQREFAALGWSPGPRAGGPEADHVPDL